MKVKIKSDGIHTEVMDEQGNVLNYVSSITIQQNAGDPVKVQLDLMCVEVEVAGEAEMIGPNYKPVKKIIYKDGTEQEF